MVTRGKVLFLAQRVANMATAAIKPEKVIKEAEEGENEAAEFFEPVADPMLPMSVPLQYKV